MCYSSSVLLRCQVCIVNTLGTRRGKIGGDIRFEIFVKTCQSVWSNATTIKRIVAVQFEFDRQTSNQWRKVPSRKHGCNFKGQEALNGQPGASNYNKYYQACAACIRAALCELCNWTEVRLNRTAANSSFCFCYGWWNVHRTWTYAKPSLRSTEEFKCANNIRMRQNLKPHGVSFTL